MQLAIAAGLAVLVTTILLYLLLCVVLHAAIYVIVCLIRPAPEHMANFYDQLAALLRAGATPAEAVAALRSRALGYALRGAMREMEPGLTAGASLARQMSGHPWVFPPQDVGLIRAAELAGDWEGICGELEDSYTRAYRGRHWVLVARVYYGILLSALVLAAPTPWAAAQGLDWYLHLLFTTLLPGLVLLTVLYGLLRIAVVVLGGFPGPRAVRDRLVLLVPLLRGRERCTCALRFLRALLSMLQAGVEAAQAMHVAADSAGNVVLAAPIRRGAGELSRGVSVERVVATLPFLTRAQRGVLATAFQAGRLEDGLRRLTEDARESLAGKSGVLRLAGVGLMGLLMTLIVGALFILGWLHVQGAIAEKTGAGDLWREIGGQ